jgi:type IV pilus assembly protein PilC
MSTFTYKVVDQKGKEKFGKIQAPSKEKANARLSAMGLLPIEIKEASPHASSNQKVKKFKIDKQKLYFGKVLKQEGLTIFTRQLSTLLEAGLPLLRALEVLAHQERNLAFKSVLTTLADNVRSGNTLSDGLMKYPKIFDFLYVSMVKAGEASGVLDKVLSRVALFMEKALKIKKKVKAAMIYPIIVIFVAMIIVSVLMIVVVPKFEQIFRDVLKSKQLPELTQTVINVSKFIQDNFLGTIGIIATVFIAYKLIRKSQPVSSFLAFLSLKIPQIGTLINKIAVSRFCRTLGTLLSSGVPLLEAINISRNVVGNIYIMNAITTIHDRVRDGEAIASPLGRSKIFDPMVTSMVDVGERTGQLSPMLNRIADNYDEDVDNTVTQVTSIIEPVMIVFLALVVGIIVIALFLPLISIIQNIG